MFKINETEFNKQLEFCEYCIRFLATFSKLKTYHIMSILYINISLLLIYSYM